VTKDFRNNLKSIFRLALILSFPLLVITVLGWFVMPHIIGYLREVIAFACLTIVFIGFILQFKSNKLRKIVLMTLWFLLLVLAFVKVSFYFNYGVKLSASALFVIFETNGSEASDFLSNYFDYKVYSLVALFVALFLISLSILKVEKDKNLFFSRKIRLLSVIILLFAGFIIHKKFINENLVLTGIHSYKEYLTAKANLKETLAIQDPKYISNVTAKDEQQTYVVVIGESTSNWHMQLYGYNRETNPLLSEIKDELLVFENVITPNVHTILALDKILTFSDFIKPNTKNNASIVQLANKAGFETFWISNQRPVGLHESIPTIIGNAAKHKKFISTDNYNYDIYDESLLPYIETALQNSAKKKIIFIHLMGTHATYSKRYPSAFNFFEGETNTSFKHSKSRKSINEYDNAIRYNDFVIREVIEKVRSLNDISYVVYFSDHGDEVFDTFDFLGHNEYHGSRPMYEIPFIVWLSDKYKKNNINLATIENLIKRQYILEDFIHSFSEISAITFDKFNPEKSIFNQNFKKKKRIVKKGEDYDLRLIK